MSFVNNLIRRAKEGATVLEVPAHRVGSIAEHMLAQADARVTRENVRNELRAGRVRLLGVPLRVVGWTAEDDREAV